VASNGCHAKSDINRAVELITLSVTVTVLFMLTPYRLEMDVEMDHRSIVDVVGLIRSISPTAIYEDKKKYMHNMHIRYRTGFGCNTYQPTRSLESSCHKSNFAVYLLGLYDERLPLY
jgi:hypothetical protein